MYKISKVLMLIQFSILIKDYKYIKLRQEAWLKWYDFFLTNKTSLKRFYYRIRVGIALIWYKNTSMLQKKDRINESSGI